MSIINTRRPFVLLVTVVVAQVLLLATQIREEGVPLMRVAAVRVVTPFHRAGTYLVDSVGGAWNNYFALRNVHRENETLNAELSELKMRIQRLESRSAEADRLGVLLAFRDAHPDAPLLAARVIAASPGSTSRRPIRMHQSSAPIDPRSLPASDASTLGFRPPGLKSGPGARWSVIPV